MFPRELKFLIIVLANEMRLLLFPDGSADIPHSDLRQLIHIGKLSNGLLLNRMKSVNLRIPWIDRPRQPGWKRLLCQMGSELVVSLNALAIFIVQKVPEDKKYALKTERIRRESTIWKIWTICSCAPKGIRTRGCISLIYCLASSFVLQ